MFSWVCVTLSCFFVYLVIFYWKLDIKKNCSNFGFWFLPSLLLLFFPFIYLFNNLARLCESDNPCLGIWESCLPDGVKSLKFLIKVFVFLFLYLSLASWLLLCLHVCISDWTEIVFKYLQPVSNLSSVEESVCGRGAVSALLGLHYYLFLHSLLLKSSCGSGFWVYLGWVLWLRLKSGVSQVMVDHLKD